MSDDDVDDRYVPHVKGDDLYELSKVSENDV